MMYMVLESVDFQTDEMAGPASQGHAATSNWFLYAIDHQLAWKEN